MEGRKAARDMTVDEVGIVNTKRRSGQLANWKKMFVLVALEMRWCVRRLHTLDRATVAVRHLGSREIANLQGTRVLGLGFWIPSILTSIAGRESRSLQRIELQGASSGRASLA
jgi:hypothetical protein